MNHFVPLLAVVVALMLVVVGCGDSESSVGGHVGSENSERSGESGSNEHRRDVESGGEGEESGTEYGLGDKYDEGRAGARLMLSYDSDSNTFTGTVENTTGSKLSRVRVEVHLSNGIELGPTTPVDLAAGESADVMLRGSSLAFETWRAHPEVGRGDAMESGEGSGEHGGEGSESRGEQGGESESRGEHR